MTGAPIDLLYRLTQRDEAYPHWGPNFGLLEHTEGAVTIETTLAEWDASLRPLQGTILWITNLLLSGEPDPAQTVILVTANIRNRITGALVTRLMSKFDITAGGPPAMLDQSPFDIAIPLDRFFLTASGSFSGVLDNTIGLHWAGYTTAQGAIGFV